MDATKPYKFIGFGAVDVTKPYKFIGFGLLFSGDPMANREVWRRLHPGAAAEAPKALQSSCAREAATRIQTLDHKVCFLFFVVFTFVIGSPPNCFPRRIARPVQDY